MFAILIPFCFPSFVHTNVFNTPNKVVIIEPTVNLIFLKFRGVNWTYRNFFNSWKYKIIYVLTKFIAEIVASSGKPVIWYKVIRYLKKYRRKNE